MKSALDYALGLIGEEAIEIAKEEHKCDRFGPDDCRPTTRVPNLQSLQDELTDLMAVVRIANMELERRGLPPLRLDDEAGIRKKMDRVVHYARRSMRNKRLAEPLLIMGTTSPE